MEVPIFWLLMWNNPQVIQDLDNYQVKAHGCAIEIIPEPKQKPAEVHGHVESLEEIDHILRQPPSRSRGKDD